MSKKPKQKDSLDDFMKSLTIKGFIQSDELLSEKLVDIKDELKTNTEGAKKLANFLSRQSLFLTLHELQLINNDVNIYSILKEHEHLVLYVEEVYVERMDLETEQLMYLIDIVDLRTIILFLTEDLIPTDKKMIEYAKKQIKESDPNSVTIYDLLKQSLTGFSKELYYEQSLQNFCRYDNSPGLISTVTNIEIPSYRIVNDSHFNPVFEFDEDAVLEKDTIRLEIVNTNFGGGAASIFNDEPYKTFAGFDIDPIWIQDCITFLYNLSIEDRLTVHAYTHNGDVIANAILRNKSEDEIYDYVKDRDRSRDDYFFPIFFQIRKVLSTTTYSGISEQVKKDVLSDDLPSSYKAVISLHRKSAFPKQCLLDASRLYVKDLLNVFNTCPALPEDCTVLRGVGTLFFSTNDRKTFKTEGFLSTTYDPLIAVSYTEKYCCLKKIKLKKGTKALFMECITRYKNESEILLPPGLEFKVVSNKIVPWTLINRNRSGESVLRNLCKNVSESDSRKRINLTVMQQI